MKIIADIHIHSHYSRATSPRLSPESLERWARIKGIQLLGTGDCTHPKWLEELRNKLEDSGGGLYRLKDSVRSAFDSGPALAEGLPNPASGAPSGESSRAVRFILSGEIATIYKKDGKLRKIHHVVLLPDFRSAAAFNAKLERAGNIRSDGRPILGLDSAELLSMLLETDDRALLIPAHIWTPWFSALGAKSGFDSIEECYGPLCANIPAVETGLSSNPPMNWALSALDRYAIISNSDAHSPGKLGREATVIEMEASFDSFGRALRVNENPVNGRPERILGTVEFFPQEGKYHYDGHRNCRVSFDPEEAAQRKGVCPVCGKALTRGVLGRVLELADRPVDESAPYESGPYENTPYENTQCPGQGGANRRPYHSLIPLREIAAELLETGETSKKLEAAYGALIEKAGSEFSVLLDMSLEQIERLRCPGLSGELLAKAVDRMRRGDVYISPGYDGEYGTIRAFAPGEKKDSGSGLFEEKDFPGADCPSGVFRTRRKEGTKRPAPESGSPPKEKKAPAVKPNAKGKTARDGAAFTLDSGQQAAVLSGAPKAIVVAGPGSGKTAVLAAKIAGLVRDGRDPASILALSFTVKAAAELRDRILRIPADASACGGAVPQASTFHSLCASILREEYAAAGLPEDFRILGESERDELLEKICRDSSAGGSAAASCQSRPEGLIRPRRLGEYIEERKRFLLLPGEGPEDVEGILPPGLGAFIPPDSGDSLAESLYGEYRDRLRSLGLVDYDGLIAGTARLLASRKNILHAYRKKYRHIFVDEYQDINFAQYALIRILVPAREDAPALWVIGDPNQAIYGFRGADKAFIDRFERDYPGAGRFELRKSFRCAAPIIEAAGQLAGVKLEGAAPGAARENTADGTAPAPVSLFRREFPTEKSEAEGIARTIASLVGGTSFFALDSVADADSGSGRSAAGGAAAASESSASPGDFAVLLRAAALSGPLVKAFLDHGIPFDLSGDTVWWEEEPVNHLLDYVRESRRQSRRLRRASSPDAPGEEILAAWEALRGEGRVPAGKKSRDLAAARKTSAKIAEKVAELARLAVLFGSVEALLDGLSLGHGIPDLPREGVRVMTIHASKGLEFDHVFVPGLEEGILPFTLFDKNGDIEEERRLLFVAMTRARRSLWLSRSVSRNFRGRVLKAAPSRFLSELGDLVPLLAEDRAVKRNPQMNFAF